MKMRIPTHSEGCSDNSHPGAASGQVIFRVVTGLATTAILDGTERITPAAILRDVRFPPDPGVAA